MEKYRITSTQLFNFTFTKNNIAGAPPGPTAGALDGWFAYVKPLSPGNHTIWFGGASVTATQTGQPNFAVDVTYHLKVSWDESTADTFCVPLWLFLVFKEEISEDILNGFLTLSCISLYCVQDYTRKYLQCMQFREKVSHLISEMGILEKLYVYPSTE